MKKSRIMSPGPIEVPQDALLAMAEPMIHHRTPVFSEMMVRVCDRLKLIAGARGDDEIFLLASSGTGAMEASVTNFFVPGDLVLIVNTGKFGERFTHMAKRMGLLVEEISFEWGTHADPEVIKQALSRLTDVKGVFITHTETSTGIQNPIPSIGKVIHDHSDALFILDAVSGFAINPLNMKEDYVDVVASASQKGLMAPPGVGFVIASKKALSRHNPNCSYYFDLMMAREMYEKPMAQTPFTPSINVIKAIDVALNHIFEEGTEKFLVRHSKMAECVRKSMESIGLKLFVSNPPYSNAITTILAPEGMDSGKIVKTLREKYGYMIAGGQDHLSGKIFRLGHMGYADRFDLIALLSATEMVLRDLGWNFTFGKSVETAMNYIYENDL